MRQLFHRYYHRVYVHFVPLHDYGPCGTVDVVAQQIGRLRRKVEQFSAEVQRKREEVWMRYDGKILSMIFRYAFQHLATRMDAPFDFDTLRRQVSIPKSTEVRITRFLELSLSQRVETNFKWACSVVASSLVRQALRNCDLG